MKWMKHTAIIGLPRAGKTVLATKIMNTCDHKTVFVNSQWEDYLELCKVAQIEPREATIQKDFKAGTFKNLGDFTIINTDDYDEVFSLLHEAFGYQRQSKTIYPVSIFIDEAHLYFPYDMDTKSDNPQWKATRDLFTRGLKYNLRLVLISQKPQLMCSKVYTLCERIIAFKLHPNDYTYFNRHNIHLTPVTVPYTYEVVE